MEVTLVSQSSPRIMPMNGSVTTTSAPNTGNAIYKDALYATFQVVSGAAATVVIEGSMDNSNWSPVTGVTASSTITLAGAGSGALVENWPSAWRYVRARTTAATTPTTCLMGV